MTTKNMALVASVVATMGVPAGAKPICEGLLNDYRITGLSVAEVGTDGKCVVVATVVVGTAAPAPRVVASSSGDVRLYSFAALEAMIKKSMIDPGTVIRYTRATKIVAVGDAVAALKAKYKAFVAETLIATAAANKNALRRQAATSLGWNTAAAGSLESQQFADLVSQQGSIDEWKVFCSGKVTFYAQALTTAGIAPASVA